MSDIFQNLSHVLRGAAFMFFTLLSISTYPERNKNNMKKILFWSMVLLAFLELKDMVFLDERFWENGYINDIVMLIDMMYVPVIALFFFETVSPGWIRWERVLPVFLPSAALTVIYILFPSDTVMNITMTYVFLFGCTVTAVILISAYRQDRRMKSYFSDTDGISVLWVRNAISALFISLVAWNILLWKQSWLGDSAYYAVSILVWAYIYSLAIKHKVIDFSETSVAPAAAQTDCSCGEDSGLTKMRLDKCMAGQELFLNPRLTLQDLAAAVGTNRTYLSDYLNNTMGMTFYEYINGLRAERSAELMKGGGRQTLAEIAEKSGFNSMSTFSRSFSRHFGCTPGQFLKKARND